MAATQRPLSGLASRPYRSSGLEEAAILGRGLYRRQVVGTDVVRSMAERAGAKISEVEGSHVIMISKPQVVADVILTAIAAVSQREEEA